MQKPILASTGSFGLAAKIPDGMRATSVKTNEVMNIAGFIFPGSHVDVLVTLRGDKNGSAVTHTVLQNVQVLAAGAKTDPDPNGKPENVGVVTLLVTPEESEKLALAQNQATQNQGTIHFVLRNGADTARPNTAPIDMDELAGRPKKEPEVVVHVKHRPPPKAPELYTVETVAGTRLRWRNFRQYLNSFRSAGTRTRRHFLKPRSAMRMLLISGLAILATNRGFGAGSQGEIPSPLQQLVAAAHPAPAAQNCSKLCRQPGPAHPGWPLGCNTH